MKTYTEDLIEVLTNLEIPPILSAKLNIVRAIVDKNNIFLAGNGGSSATASHFKNDLVKLVHDQTNKQVYANCLSDSTPLITAIGNDFDYDFIFSQQLEYFMKENDLLIVFSGSGNSKNILNAVDTAKEMNNTTIGLLGNSGKGKLSKEVDIAIDIKSSSMQIIEDVHLSISHSLVLDVIDAFRILKEIDAKS